MESQLRLTVVLAFGSLYIPYQKLLHILLLYASLTFSGISTLSSELFGVSAQTDIGISIWHSLYILPEFIAPTSGVHLSHIVRYFYSYPGGDPNSFESQFRLTVVFAFDSPYIPCQKILHLL